MKRLVVRKAINHAVIWPAAMLAGSNTVDAMAVRLQTEGQQLLDRAFKSCAAAETHTLLPECRFK
jgi:hypothetical protein